MKASLSQAIDEALRYLGHAIDHGYRKKPD